ncbi:MAG: transporter substrate binding protein [Candidatus Dependentiae bacterium]|nr:transporter substrate binding protein [Candidatus Dependentiae bacterium]
MKSAPLTRLHFNTEAPRKTLVSIEHNSFRWEIDVQNLKKIAQGPIVFVFNQDKNAWAHDFINDFKTKALGWIEDGISPEFDYLAIAESRSDLQEKIMFHPFFAASAEQPPLMVSIGDTASAEVARYRVARGRTTIPQLFCITGDPHKLDLMDLSGNLLSNTNGVCGVAISSVKKQVRTLKSLSRSVKNVAIVSSRNSRFDSAIATKDAAASLLIDECERHGMRASRLYLVEGMNVDTDLRVLANRYDAFITLRDDTIYGLAADLASFCSKYKVIFFASELSSVFRGAAIGFGNVPGDYVPSLLELMALQREHHLPLDAFDFAVVEESALMRHNMKSVKAQVRDLTQEKEDLLDMLSIHASY